MIEKANEPPTLPRPPKEDRTDPNRRSCRSFRTLKDWQVKQYRKAVDENKWYMGERLGRYVDWAEAEEDFLHNGYYGCAPKWRRHFCSNKCSHFTTCDLTQHL